MSPDGVAPKHSHPRQASLYVSSRKPSDESRNCLHRRLPREWVSGITNSQGEGVKCRGTDCKEFLSISILLVCLLRVATGNMALFRVTILGTFSV